jgi:hypothetical protein
VSGETRKPSSISCQERHIFGTRSRATIRNPADALALSATGFIFRGLSRI